MSKVIETFNEFYSSFKECMINNNNKLLEDQLRIPFKNQSIVINDKDDKIHDGSGFLWVQPGTIHELLERDALETVLADALKSYGGECCLIAVYSDNHAICTAVLPEGCGFNSDLAAPLTRLCKVTLAARFGLGLVCERVNIAHLGVLKTHKEGCCCYTLDEECKQQLGWLKAYTQGWHPGDPITHPGTVAALDIWTKLGSDLPKKIEAVMSQAATDYLRIC